MFGSLPVIVLWQSGERKCPKRYEPDFEERWDGICYFFWSFVVIRVDGKLRFEK